MLNALVVDDDADSADVLASLLEHLDCRVRVACSGRDALISIENEAPEIAFIDIALPDILGYELAPLLRRVGADAVIVALSGMCEDEWRESALRAGCDRFIAKPCKLSELEEALALWKERRARRAPP